MREVSNEEFTALTKRPSLKCVDNTTRSIMYNVIKNNPSQDELVLIPQYMAPSFEEDRMLRRFGIYLERSVFIEEDRKYVIWIEDPLIQEMEDFTKEVLSIAEVFRETYIPDKVPHYYFFNGEFPSRDIYLEVDAALKEKYQGVISLFPLRYSMDSASIRDAHLREMREMIGDRGYNLVPFSDEVKTLYDKLSDGEPFSACKDWIESTARELTANVANPLLVFPPVHHSLPFDASDKIGTYLYAKLGIPFFDGDKPNNPVLQVLNLMTLDPYTNLLSERIRYIKSLPDLCFILPKGTPSKYITLNLKHTLNLKNSVKFFFLGTAGPAHNMELDLSEVRILSISEHYGLNIESVGAEENYRSLHKDVIQLQKFLSDSDPPITHSNTILFLHEDRLALGYIGKLKATIESVLVPLDPDLSYFQAKLDLQDISRMIPINMLLNAKDYPTQISSLMKLFRETYPGKAPSTQIYLSQDSMDGILLSMSGLTNQYRSYDIPSMTLWCLWSPLAKMNRERFTVVEEEYLDLKEFRSESTFYTFFGTAYGNLSTTINLSPRFVRGGVVF